MKVLWIVNTIFPAPSEVLGLPAPVFGGWMYGLADMVSKVSGIELSVATTYNGKDFKKVTIDGIHYLLLPSENNIKYDKSLESLWVDVCEEFNPDVIHIHGTEFSHGLACMRILPDLKYVISIQGLVNIYSKYYYAGISFWDIFKNISFRDVVRLDTIFHQKEKFKQRGKLEREYLLRTNHVMGRTNWDYAHTKGVRPDINYHFCNESLRDAFYSAKKWSLNNCEEHSVFLSQASYPIKGLHQMIKALLILKEDFPKLKIKVGGDTITENKTFKNKLKLSGYGKYISRLLENNNLNNDIIFLGALSADQMILEYQKAHVFICPSSIENSPNSVGESQLLGTPVIASYVGGIPDMIEDGKTGLLYRFEEIEMLAENIRRIFNESDFAKRMSDNAMQTASLRHNKSKNLEKVISSYSVITD